MDDTSPLERGVAYLTDEEDQISLGDAADTPVLSRRKALASFTVLGATGALTGAGIQAYFSDMELFGNNTAHTGNLDLGLAWETHFTPADGERTLVDSAGDCGDDTAGTFVDDSDPAIGLSDVRPGAAGTTEICFRTHDNAAWVWFGATCPEPDLAKAIEATVTFDAGCDGDLDAMVPTSSEEAEGVTELTGSLCDVLLVLSRGVRLGKACLPPETTHCLTVEWEFPEPQYPHQFAEYEDGRAEFVLDVQAVQCRHNEDPTNPIGRACDQEACLEDGPGISWIAFCTEDGELSDGDVTFEILERNVDGEPNKIGWDSGTNQLSTVVLYYGTPDGPIIENFTVAPGTTRGTATIGEGEPTSAFENDEQSPSDPCPAGEMGIKYEWTGDAFTFEAH